MDFVIIISCCKVIEPRHVDNPARDLGYRLNGCIWVNSKCKNNIVLNLFFKSEIEF